jgi:hypothetical protein
MDRRSPPADDAQRGVDRKAGVEQPRVFVGGLRPASQPAQIPAPVQLAGDLRSAGVAGLAPMAKPSDARSALSASSCGRRPEAEEPGRWRRMIGGCSSKKMAICGCSGAKVPKCAVGSFPVRVFAGNFLASMLNCSRRTTRIRPESSWSAEHARGDMMPRFASDESTLERRQESRR